MNYKNSVENYLYNYQYIKLSIDNLKFILETEFQPLGLKALRYDKDVVKSNNMQSFVENEAIYIADKTKEISKEIKTNESIIKVLDRCIEALPYKHKRIIELRYTKSKMTWVDIANELHYSISHCKRLHSGAIYKISVSMYGLKAIKTKRQEEG